MIVLNNNGEYTELFKDYSSRVLDPAIRAAVENAIEWLRNNNAEPIDFITIEGVIYSEIALKLSSAWMTEIEKIELAELNEETSNE